MCPQHGFEAAAKRARLQDADQQLQEAATRRGERSALLLQSPSEEAAAEQLLSSQAMLAACPGMHGAQCACVEVRLLARLHVCQS